jgi:hypothetical protein
MLSLMCLNSRAGRNACLVLIKSKDNGDRMFEHNRVCRDSPNENGFCPGAYVVIVNPMPVTDHFGDAEVGIPILNFKGTFYLVDKSQSSFVIRNKYGCFLFKECMIEISNFSVERVTCRGDFCDAVDLVRENKTGYKGCACFYMCDLKSRLLYRFRLKITNPSGEVFESDFMSRRMTRRMTHDGIPRYTDLDGLYKAKKEDDLWDQADVYFQKGNELGG